MRARAAAPEKLAPYLKKRDFSRTREPKGGDAGRGAAPGSRLIVQHHFARRDHYDLRLEIDGVLVSWAVTRGPSANPADKRLAVRTEDHPLDYATFEGLIPKGEYGGGTVILWEYTSFTPLNGDPAEALAKGEIKFLAHGARMRGGWVLVRMKTKEKRENWLLIKERDEFAEDDDALASRFPDSVDSGRSRAEIEQGAPARNVAKRAKTEARKSAPPPPVPDFVAPQLCAETQIAPTSSDWLIEMKYDGYRLQIARGGDKVKIFTRTGLDWTARFPTIAAAALALPCRSALIDGEGVVFDSQGISDFPALVAALETKQAGGIEFVAFDLLALDGEDLRAKPLEARKARLRDLLGARGGAIRFADHVAGEGPAVFQTAVKAGAEGVIAKRAKGAYVSGRSHDWLKIKADRREDVLIVGYNPSTKHGSFASLLAAVEKPEGLAYVGRVGTGYDAAQRAKISPLLSGRKSKTPAPDLLGAELAPKGTVFVARPFRAEVRFGGWTGDGQMRQARFLGLREDRLFREPAVTATRGKARSETREAETPITHASRVLFPKDGVTKGDVAAYYAKVAARMAPYLDHRPVSIVRAPDSIEQTFFQRHPLKGMTLGIIPVEAEGETYISLDGAVGLHTAAQFGAIELHGWMSLADAPDRPDRLIFDLDPDENVGFAEVKAAAKEIADHLAAIGLKSWPMITGGKGVHVVAPLDRTLGSDEVEAFAHGFAEGLARDEPKRFVATMSKARRAGRIYVDWMRNKRTSTAILPWSLRARPGAKVAVPLTWAGLTKIDSAAAYDIETAPAQKDPWAPLRAARQTIPAAALEFMKRQAG